MMTKSHTLMTCGTAAAATAAAAGLATWYWYRVRARRRSGITGRSPPSPPGHPILGHTLQLMRSKGQLHKLLIQWANELGPVYELYIPGSMGHTYVVSDPAIAAFVCNGKGPDAFPKAHQVTCAEAHAENGYSFQQWADDVNEGAFVLALQAYRLLEEVSAGCFSMHHPCATQKPANCRNPPHPASSCTQLVLNQRTFFTDPHSSGYWLAWRKSLAPCFSSGNLRKALFPTAREKACALAEAVAEQQHRVQWTVELDTLIKCCLMDITGRTQFGKELQCLEARGRGVELFEVRCQQWNGNYFGLFL